MRILVCYDNSVMSKIALSLSSKHAKAFNAKLYILQSFKDNLTKKELREAKKELEEIKKEIYKLGVFSEICLETSDLSPGEHIIQFVEENEINEIVIGYGVSKKNENCAFGTTIDYIIERAPCPVVIAR